MRPREPSGRLGTKKGATLAALAPDLVTASRIFAILLASTFVAVAACGDQAANKAAPSASARRVIVSDDPNSVPPLGDTPDPRAAKDLLARVPSATALPSASLVGTDTGEELPDGGTTILRESASEERAVAHVLSMSTLARAQNSVERLLRASVYFDLVDRCRDAEGKILPPESVRLTFVIGGDGLIVPTTVEGNPKSPKYADAALCMVRELIASSFRAPADTKDVNTTVITDVPSAD